MPIQCDAPATWEIEARNQIGQRTLATNGCAHQSDGLSRRDFQANVAQCQPIILLVRQAHVLEPYPPAGASDSHFPGIDFPGGIKQFKYTFRCCQSALQKLTYPRHALDRSGSTSTWAR